MTQANTITKYPNLRKIHGEKGSPECILAVMFEFGNSSLPLLESAISHLPINHSVSLRGLINDLFSANAKKAMAAICELIAFGWLIENGLILAENIGFPSDWKGEDPPFEGAFLLKNQTLIPFDIKDGSGVGIVLLEERLQKAMDKEFSATSGTAPKITVAVNAPTGQRWVNDSFNEIIEQFKNELKSNGFRARVIEIPAGSGTVRVGLDSNVGASLIELEEKAEYISLQILDHAHGKAKSLQKTQAQSFALMYVNRPDSGGSDFDEYSIRAAWNSLANDSTIPNSLVSILFLQFNYKNMKLTPNLLIWNRVDVLSGMFDGYAELYSPVPRVITADRTSFARTLGPADVIFERAIVTGSCDLRDAGCLARGSIDSVLVFFAKGRQINACSICRSGRKWP